MRGKKTEINEAKIFKQTMIMIMQQKRSDIRNIAKAIIDSSSKIYFEGKAAAISEMIELMKKEETDVASFTII